MSSLNLEEEQDGKVDKRLLLYQKVQGSIPGGIRNDASIDNSCPNGGSNI